MGRLLSVSPRILSSTSSDVFASVWRRIVTTTLSATAILGWSAAVACDRSATTSRADSTTPTVAADSLAPKAAAVVGSGWDLDAGAFLVLPTVDGGLNSGSFLRPEASELTVGDTTGIRAAIGDGQLELFARGGQRGRAVLTVEPPPKVEAGCTAWPVARLALDKSLEASASQPWTAAFAAGRVMPIALDSIEGLAARDSSRLAIDLTRLASALRDDTVATFKGLPFVVLRAWRSKGLPTEFVVATLARRVNQEDSPKEERLVMVVDQTGTDPRQWTVAWHERASGAEDELVVAEPLLAFHLTRSTAAVRDVHLLFGRDDGVALGAAVLVRGANGWRVLWESAVAGCD